VPEEQKTERFSKETENSGYWFPRRVDGGGMGMKIRKRAYRFLSRMLHRITSRGVGIALEPILDDKYAFRYCEHYEIWLLIYWKRAEDNSLFGDPNWWKTIPMWVLADMISRAVLLAEELEE